MVLFCCITLLNPEMNTILLTSHTRVGTLKNSFTYPLGQPPGSYWPQFLSNLCTSYKKQSPLSILFFPYLYSFFPCCFNYIEILLV